MKSTRSFKKQLSEVQRLWGEGQYDRALDEVEGLLRSWPGSARLHILWASLVQLQENPAQGLDEVKKVLQRAVAIDPDSPAGALELGHFLDAVEDNPRAASKVFAEAILLARRLLIDGLLGQTKALLQLKKREEALRCLTELLYLAEIDSSAAGSDKAVPNPVGRKNGPLAHQLEDLLREAFVNRSA
jgi:tetratricopeptide (TPR) repeat protein